MIIFYCIGSKKYYELQKQSEETKDFKAYRLSFPFFGLDEDTEENKEQIKKFFDEDIKFVKIE